MDFLRHSHILAPFFRRRWPHYSLGVAVLITVDLLQLIIPRLTGQAVDLLVARDPGLGSLLARMAAIALLIAGLRYLYRELIMGTTRHLEYFLRERLFTHALRLPLRYFDQHGPGQLMALTLNDITAVRVAVGLGVLLLVDAVIQGLFSLFVMARFINWQLTWQAVLPLPVVLLATAFLGRPMHRRFKRVQEKFGQLTEFAQETFAGARVIKGFAAEPVALDRFTAVSRQTVAANLSLAKLQAAYTPITHTLPLFGYAIALATGGRLIIDGVITIGDLTAFIGYLSLLMWPVIGFSYLVATVQRGSASLARLGELLDQPAYEADLPADAAPLPAADITIRRLTYSYPGSEVLALRDISLTVPAGAVVGIVGRTGAGKSTLLRLLLRLYDPPAGTIFIGDAEIHTLDYLSLRQNIGYVPQDSLLFARTIGDNIAFAGDHSRQDILKAARTAAVDEDIDSKPLGFGTVLGEKGRRLSGGQQQRVAIARALVKQPPILLLDDVFAALDYATQRQLLANMRHISAGRTTLVVSQRVAAVKDADLIIVLEDGAIAEQGDHATLVAAGGLYHRLYQQQLAGGDEP